MRSFLKTGAKILFICDRAIKKMLKKIPGQAGDDIYDDYTIPCSSIAWATFMKPAILAPLT